MEFRVYYHTWGTAGGEQASKYLIASLMTIVLASILILREPSNLPFYPFYVVDTDASYSQEDQKRVIIINNYYEIYTYFISFLSLVFNRPFLSTLVFLTILGLTGGLIEQNPNWLLLLLPSPIGGMKISTLSLWIRFRSLNATASQSNSIQMVNEWV